MNKKPKRIKTEYTDRSFRIYEGGNPCDDSLSKLINFWDTQKEGGEYLLSLKKRRTVTQNNIWHGVMREWGKLCILTGKNGNINLSDEDELKYYFKMWAGFGKRKVVTGRNGKKGWAFIPKSTSNLSEESMLEHLAIVKVLWAEEQDFPGKCKYLERQDIQEYMWSISK